MTFFVIILLVFLIAAAATKFHRKYLNDMAYYRQKLVSISEDTLELEHTRTVILSITKQYREARPIIEFPCANIPGTECTLCNQECIFRRTDIDDK